MQISVSSQTTLNNAANNFVFALYDASAPTVLLESQAPAKPYGNPIQVTFNYNCLSGHIYIIKLWESVDTTPTGVVRNSFSQSVNSTNVSVKLRPDEYLEADVTTGLTSGTTSYINTDWADWKYSIERIGMGTMVPDYTIDTNPNYTAILTGGFSLIQDGDVFQPNEKFVVRFEPQVTTASPPAGSASAIFSNGRIITEDTDFSNSDAGQALFIQSIANKITLTLPALSTIQDYTFFYFFSFGGQHYNAVFNAFGTDKIQYQIIHGNHQVGQIILGQNESLKIFKANGVWNVENNLSVDKVGEILFNYLYAPMNTLPLMGQLVSRTEYPRLWAYVQTLPDSVVTDTAWLSTFTVIDGVTYYTNKGFFSAGDGSTTFRLPLVNNFIRPVQSPRVPGSMEPQTIQRHSHDISASKQNNGLGGFGA